MEEKISYVSLIYDNENKKFIEGRAIVNGGPIDTLTDHSEIVKLIDDLKRQEGCTKISELTDSGIVQLAYANNEKGIELLDSKWEIKLASLNIGIDKEEPKLVLNREKSKEKVAAKRLKAKLIEYKKKIIAGAAVVASVVGLSVAIGACSSSKAEVTPEVPIETEVTEENTEIEEYVIEKVSLPDTWEDYMSMELENETQRMFFSTEMNWIQDNVQLASLADVKDAGFTISTDNADFGKESTVVSDYSLDEAKLFLTPELTTYFNLYYNATLMDKSEIASIIGDYDISQIGAKNQEAIRLIRYSVSINQDFINPAGLLQDELVSSKYNEYADLWKEVLSTESKSDRKKLEKQMEDMLVRDFLAVDDKIDLDEHPSATVILQVFPYAMDADGYKFSGNVIYELSGSFNNWDSNGHLITVDANGIIDLSCGPIESRIEGLKQEINQLQTEKVMLDAANRVVLNMANNQEQYDNSITISEYDKLTKSSLAVAEVESLMNAELTKKLELEENYNFDNMGELMESISAVAINERLGYGKNTGEFNPHTNPSGGNKGDTYVDPGVKPTITVTDKEIEENKDIPQETKDYIKEHDEELKNQAMTDVGASYFSNEDVQTVRAADWQDSDAQKQAAQQQVELQVQADKAYEQEHKQNIENGGYDQNGHRVDSVKEEVTQGTNINTSTPTPDPSYGEYQGHTSGNKNQQGQRKENVDESPEVEIVDDPTHANDNQNKPSESHTEEVQVKVESTSVETAKPSSENPNQNRASENHKEEVVEVTIESTPVVEQSNVIEGTTTYDSEGAVDISQFGELGGSEEFDAELDAIASAYGFSRSR